MKGFFDAKPWDLLLKQLDINNPQAMTEKQLQTLFYFCQSNIKSNIPRNLSRLYSLYLNYENLKRYPSLTAEINTQSSTSVFMQAASSGMDRFLDLALSNTEDPSALFAQVTLTGNTALHLAAYSGEEQTIRVLLKHGMVADSVNKFGKKPLHLCIESQNNQAKSRCFNLLLDETDPQTLSQEDNNRENLLFQLIRQGMADEALKLYGKHPELAKGRNLQGESVLHIALQMKLENLCLLLIADDELLQSKNHQNQNTLHYAATAGLVDETRFIVDRLPALLNERDCKGNTPLHYATQANQREVIDQLIQANAKTDVYNMNHRTPAELTHEPTCQELFESKTPGMSFN